MKLDKATIQKESTTVSSCARFTREIEKMDVAEKKTVALISNFTLTGLDACLKTKSFLFDIPLDVYMGEYGQWQQEILGEKLYTDNPEMIFALLDLCGVGSDDWSSIHAATDEEFEERMQHVVGTITSMVATLTEKTDAKIVLSTMPSMARPLLGIADNTHARGYRQYVQSINDILVARYADNAQVLLFDFDGWLGEIGKAKHWYDKYLFLGDMRLSPEAFPALAEELCAYLVPLTGKTKKCIVLDCDNTLWGGVVGEDGVGGIELVPTGPGQQYYMFQQALLGLHKRGVILAINSKNNPEDVQAVFDEHPNMLLKPEHFASMQINWDNKAENMKRIAEEIGIGTDSFVFFDDDKTNQELIRQTLPEIDVIEMPEDSSKYLETLLSYKGFSSFSVTEEDTKRGAMYAEQKKRRAFEQGAIDMDAFLRGLNLKVRVEPVSEKTLPRSSQLTQKTNQFNLTTKRYQEEDISNLIDDNAHAWTLSVTDDFGDYGITGLAIVKDNKDVWDVDTFLLSCRVLGKRVEEQFLSHVLQALKQKGAKKVIARHIPTQKNAQTVDFYERMGFAMHNQDAEETQWVCDLDTYECAPIDFIEVV